MSTNSTSQSIAFADRAHILEQARVRKMARSAHAYVRGNTLQFYEWLQRAHNDTLPQGPPIWICGDCHVGNLGPVASADGRVEIEIRDLDQTVIGNPAHDLIRLALSLAMSARGSDLPGVTTAHMVEHIIQGYQASLLHPFATTASDAKGDDLAPFKKFSKPPFAAAGNTSPKSAFTTSSPPSPSAAASGHSNPLNAKPLKPSSPKTNPAGSSHSSNTATTTPRSKSSTPPTG
jgi:hypothetical protein